MDLDTIVGAVNATSDLIADANQMNWSISRHRSAVNRESPMQQLGTDLPLGQRVMIPTVD